jgi:hypothetical protein
LDSRSSGCSPWLHHYPWQIALQHCLLPFRGEHAKPKAQNVYLQTVLNKGRLH